MSSRVDPEFKESSSMDVFTSQIAQGEFSGAEFYRIITRNIYNTVLPPEGSVGYNSNEHAQLDNNENLITSVKPATFYGCSQFLYEKIPVKMKNVIADSCSWNDSISSNAKPSLNQFPLNVNPRIPSQNHIHVDSVANMISAHPIPQNTVNSGVSYNISEHPVHQPSVNSNNFEYPFKQNHVNTSLNYITYTTPHPDQQVSVNHINSTSLPQIPALTGQSGLNFSKSHPIQLNHNNSTMDTKHFRHKSLSRHTGLNNLICPAKCTFEVDSFDDSLLQVQPHSASYTGENYNFTQPSFTFNSRNVNYNLHSWQSFSYGNVSSSLYNSQIPVEDFVSKHQVPSTNIYDEKSLGYCDDRLDDDIPELIDTDYFEYKDEQPSHVILPTFSEENNWRSQQKDLVLEGDDSFYGQECTNMLYPFGKFFTSTRGNQNESCIQGHSDTIIPSNTCMIEEIMKSVSKFERSPLETFTCTSGNGFLEKSRSNGHDSIADTGHTNSLVMQTPETLQYEQCKDVASVLSSPMLTTVTKEKISPSITSHQDFADVIVNPWTTNESMVKTFAVDTSSSTVINTKSGNEMSRCGNTRLEELQNKKYSYKCVDTYETSLPVSTDEIYLHQSRVMDTKSVDHCTLNSSLASQTDTSLQSVPEISLRKISLSKDETEWFKTEKQKCQSVYTGAKGGAEEGISKVWSSKSKVFKPKIHFKEKFERACNLTQEDVRDYCEKVSDSSKNDCSDTWDYSESCDMDHYEKIGHENLTTTLKDTITLSESTDLSICSEDEFAALDLINSNAAFYLNNNVALDQNNNYDKNKTHDNEEYIKSTEDILEFCEGFEENASNRLIKSAMESVISEDSYPSSLSYSPEKLEFCDVFYWCHACEVSLKTETECLCHSQKHTDVNKVNLKYYYVQVYGIVTKHWKGYWNEHAEETFVYLCGLCDLPLSCLRFFKQHMAWHGYGLSCKKCDRKFGSIKELLKHKMRSHAGIPKGKCTSKVKRKASNLKRQRYPHRRGRYYGCQYCGKKLSTKGSLKIHTRLHTGNFPFKCAECRNMYPQKVQLQIHMKKHSV